MRKCIKCKGHDNLIKGDLSCHDSNIFKVLFFIITFISLVNAQSSEVAKPSFDCAKAQTEVEKMICGDESGDLQELDSIMTLKYKEIKAQLTFKDKKSF